MDENQEFAFAGYDKFVFSFAGYGEAIQLFDEKKGKITDKDGVIRFDFQFSYWIFFWFLFYFLISLQRERSPLTQQIYKYTNPIVSFIIALIENVIVFIVLLFYHPTFSLLIKYLLMMFILKIIPLYFLYHYTLPKKDSQIFIFYKNSFFSFIGLFILYNLYLFWNETNILDVYQTTIYFVFTEQNKTFLFHLFSKF